MKQTGVTLIELLIVISVIGVLSGGLIRVINLNKTRGYARDGVRQANIEKLVTALEGYSHVEGLYPTGDDVGDGNSVLRKTYLNTWPQGFADDGAVDEAVWGYKYTQLEDGDAFALSVKNSAGNGCYKYHTVWGEMRNCSVCDSSDSCE